MKTLITCHANADCDAFAAMLAAGRLYPDAYLFFPGTREASLAKVVANLDKRKYKLAEAGQIEWDKIGRLVLVDTRQAARVAHVEKTLNAPNVEIIVWDHHPPSADDIKNIELHAAKTGAVTSLLCEELKKRGVTLDPEEATLLGLGIYADTGSFTYSSTTAEDFLAASWLLSQGMDVNKINDLTRNELNAAQIRILNDLLESARVYHINHVTAAIAETDIEHYLGDFAYLAHKLMEMEKFPVLFALGNMGDRIQVVARGLSGGINVGEICARLGGGGHAYAASASVRSKSLAEVRDNIVRLLSELGAPEKRARDYLSSPAIGVDTNATIREADELMLHFGLKAIPVFNAATRSCAGLLDAQTAARANAHGLGAEKVAEYMQRRVFTLGPNATIKELSEIIIGARQRLVPIVENETVIGVVTRTDLINVFANDSAQIAALPNLSAKTRNLGKLMTDRLPPETRKILELAGALGGELNMPVYAVGGFARDLLLNYPNHDIDLVAEGDGIKLARALARELGGRVREHQKFLTSVVIYHDAKGEERHIDVATARLEYYEYPAALPTVELSSIKMDLFRRDFSINALAVRLDGDRGGDLVDFFGGARDIKDGRIRVLHTLSFVEDPTRCIRAVRFEQRYKFRLGPGTEKLIKNMLPMRLLEKLSPVRIFHEFKSLCEEDTAAECLLRLNELGVLKALGPRLELTPGRKETLKRAKRIVSWYKLLFREEKFHPWIAWFYALSHNLSYAEALENYRSLGLPEGKKNEIMRQRELARLAKPKALAWQKKYDAGVGKISDFHELLKDLSLYALLHLMTVIHDGGLEKNISLYITQWRDEKADITGDDLRKLGLPPGPLYATLLKFALMAKLDGKASTASRQLALVKEKLKESKK